MKTKWPHIDTISGLTPHQREQLSRATSGPVGIFAGKPGSGKTYSTAAMIREIVARHGTWPIAVAAPTGKAAVRCTAALKANGVNVEATTIHRLLGVQRSGHDGKGWGFQHNAQNRLPQKFLIVDESSMIDTDLCASLLSAVESGTHVLFCGDVYQLPPVGHGAPLRDMIATGLPYGELTEVKRQGDKLTDVVRVCDELTRGEPYRPSEQINTEAGRNVLHIESPRAAISLEVLKRLLANLPPGIDPVWDVQVLCAVNTKGELARKKVNELMQEWLNPHGKREGSNPFRLGDKVICTTNTTLDLVPDDTRQSQASRSRLGPSQIVGVREFVANGEIGKVVHVEPKRFHVRFDSPARTVLVLTSGKKQEGKAPSSTATATAVASKEDPERSDTGCDFALGYAITVHRAQGSQWKIPISLIDEYPGARQVCCRESWVTALSRPEVMTITIGRKGTIDRDCRRVALTGRKTFLREELETSIQKP